jgi:DNA-binding MarR family transcriptional regulator
MATALKLTVEDFRKQAEFRHQLRKFLRLSELSSKSAGLEHNQFLLLLAVKGLPVDATPNISTVAERLQIEQHSAVELVDRSVTKGVLERYREGADRRKVFLRLTDCGEKLLNEIALRNRTEIMSALPALLEFLNSL